MTILRLVIGLAIVFGVGIAQAVLAQAASARLEEAQTRNSLGARLASEGRYQEAAEAFEEAVRVAPDLVIARYNLGLARVRLGDSAKAVAAFEVAVRIRPDYGDAWYQLGQALHSGGRYLEAAGAFGMALGLKPDDPDIRFRLGLSYWRLERWSETVEQWEAVLTGSPDHPAVPKLWKDLPRAYYNLGTAHQAKGRLDGAAKAYREAIRLAPEVAEAHYNLAIVYEKLGRPAEAGAAFRESLGLRAESPEALCGLGNVYIQQDSLDAALALFRSALEIRRDHLEAYYGIARAHLRRGRIPQAQQVAAEIVRLAPDVARSHAYLAFVYEHNPAGERYGEGHRAQEAIEAYQKASVLDPEDAGYHYNVGVIHGRHKRWRRAAAAFRQAIEIDSTHSEALKWLPVAEARHRGEILKRQKAQEEK